jgi:hypothetical protein
VASLLPTFSIRIQRDNFRGSKVCVHINCVSDELKLGTDAMLYVCISMVNLISIAEIAYGLNCREIDR